MRRALSFVIEELEVVAEKISKAVTKGAHGDECSDSGAVYRDGCSRIKSHRPFIESNFALIATIICHRLPING